MLILNYRKIDFCHIMLIRSWRINFAFEYSCVYFRSATDGWGLGLCSSVQQILFLCFNWFNISFGIIGWYFYFFKSLLDSYLKRIPDVIHTNIRHFFVAPVISIIIISCPFSLDFCFFTSADKKSVFIER